MKERKYLKEHLENAQVLIIDEISMLHAKQLNLVNQVLKYFKESEEAFGGIQVIVAGDFFSCRQWVKMMSAIVINSVLCRTLGWKPNSVSVI